MMSKYNRSCIFTGVLDSLCLSCQIYLKVEDLECHVETPQHRSSLKSVNYVVKYKKDLIWKIKQGYYCEICNVVIRTEVKLQIHLCDSVHINNKPKHLLKRLNEGVLVYDDIFIEMKVWHGLSNGTCFICSVDYDDEKSHLSEPLHVVNLVQSNIELKDKMVYRKMDDNLINCLVCNTLLSVESKESHIESPEHLKQYSKCEEIRKKLNNQNNDLQKQIDLEDANLVKTSETKEASLKEELVVSDNSTTLKTADSSCLTENDSTTNNTCVTKYKGEKKLLSPQDAYKQAINFAKNNHMKYKRNSTYCKVCDVRLSSSLKVMQEHVLETCHKEKVDKFNLPKSSTNKTGICDTKTMLDYIESESNVTNMFYDDIVINDDICIEAMSFNMIGISGGKLRCHTCEVSFHPSQLKVHYYTYNHKNAMLITPVLVHFRKEFIREVKSGVFHCGHCNFIEASLDGLQDHLKSIEHLNVKLVCRDRLTRYLPEIMKKRQASSFINYMRMLHA